MHQVPNLKYKYGDLEPYFDEETMRLHHTKHHQAYVDKLNAALEKYPDLAQKPVEELLKDLNNVPEEIRTAVRNHGGGHWNHSFFWEILQPANPSTALGVGKETLPKEKMIGLIDQTFGVFSEFQKQFKEAALGRFGSGWTWLVFGVDSKLKIVTTANQDTPISEGLRPLLALDVWEHAYYLKYQNRRADYIDAFWQVVNWARVEELLGA